MYEIHASILIDASPQRVFDCLTDYEQFFRGPGMTCRLIHDGQPLRNGLGAVRQVDSDGTVFTEEITAFDPPRHFEYVIVDLARPNGRLLRFEHELGWIDVVDTGNQTRVEWKSRFSIQWTLVGRLLERVIGAKAATAFRRLLEQAKAELESSQSAADPRVHDTRLG